MKKSLSILTIAFLFFSFITAHNYMVDYEVKNDFTVKIKGSSNLHDWESTIEIMTGTASISFGESGDLQITDCQVSIPAKSIKSSKGKRMDKKTMKALKESEYPTIDYSLTSFEDMVNTETGFAATATGNLSVTGTTKLISIDITGTQLENGSIEITGSKDMKMTDFNIKPPTALLGTMRTRDEITIEFKVILDNP
jgi:polyisoprenoid-binding protein YceI